jgi:transposase
MGIITGDNIFYLVGGENKKKPLNGYVMSFSIRGGTGDFKKYVLNPNGYLDQNTKPATVDSEYKMKSRCLPRDINVTMTSGKTVIKTVHEKQVVFWSKKYADKAKAEREIVIRKAMAMVNDPQKYNRASSYGAAKYVKNMEFDKKTGEVITSGKMPYLDGDRIHEEEMFDGYYAIVTSEMEMPDQDVIDTYRGLWEIEETFRITKGTLETRPVYVSLKEHINAHFLTCFIALVILRILQKQTKRRYSCETLVDCLNSINCVNEQENLHLFSYRSDISDAIGEALSIDFTKKRLRLGEIKSIIADSKK